MSTAPQEPLAAVPAQPPMVPQESTAPMTEYVILTVVAEQKEQAPNKPELAAWMVSKRLSARGANAAIREYLKTLDKPDGTYVAVPARSWQPVTVKTETTTKLTLT